MNSKWVISAHIPKVERNPSKRDEASKTKSAPNDKDLDDEDFLKTLLRNEQKY